MPRRANDLVPLLSILLNEHDVPPSRGAEMAGIVVRIARPGKAVIGHLIPLFARDLARFAADAHRRVGEETNLDILLHVIVAALIRALNAFADHRLAQASGLRRRLVASGTVALVFFIRACRNGRSPIGICRGPARMLVVPGGG